MPNNRLQCQVCCWLVVAAAATAVADTGANPSWGSADSLEQVLARRLTLRWEGVPLDEALDRLSTTQSLPIFLDRRADPNQRVSLVLDDVTLRQAIARLSSSSGLGSSELSTVVYIGPLQAAAELRTLVALIEERVKRLSRRRQAPWQQRQPLSWSRLAEPRQILDELAANGGVPIDGVDEIPHDVWRAASLPPSTLTERISLLVVGFDRTLQLSPTGQRVRLVAIERPVSIQRHYRHQRAASSVEMWRASLPDAQITLAEQGVLLRGRVEDHERFAELVGESGRRRARSARPRSRRRQSERQAYTLRVAEQPLRRVLSQLGGQLGLTYSYDGRPTAANHFDLDQRISFSVENVDLDDLLTAVLAPAGLVHHREGRQVRISRR